MKKLGDAIEATRELNCSKCVINDTCKDKRKSKHFCCSFFYEEDSDPSSKDFASWLRNLTKSESVVSDQWGIDDRDAPLAPNFYRFCVGEQWLNAKPTPFPWQLEVGMRIYGDSCLAKDTLVTTTKGLIEIQNLVPGSYSSRENLKVLSHDNKIHKVIAGGITGKKRLFKVESSGNVPIRATEDHRFMILTDDFELKWEYLRNLKVGDFVVGTSSQLKFKDRKLLDEYRFYTKKFSKKIKIKQTKYVTAELARLIGYLVSDGSYSNYSVTYTNNDPELHKDFVRCLKTICNSIPVVNTYVSKKAKTTRVHSVELLEYLAYIGLEISSKENKKIPQFILEAPVELQAHFIQAVFDSDGSYGKERYGIRLSLTAPNLIIGIGVMLRNMGINFSYASPYRRQKNRRMMSGLQIVDPLAYTNKIASLSTVKAGNLKDQVIKRKRQTPKTGGRGANMPSGWLPHGNRLLKRICDITGEKVKGYNKSNALNHDGRVFALNLKNINVASVPEPYRYRIKKIMQSKYSFHEINQIVPEGYDYVYDITVEDAESFVANGIIVHNCPWCSRKDWYKNGIPFDIDPLEIPEHMRLRKNGRCPACGRTVVDGIKAGLEHDVQNFIGIVGQRSGKCLVADTKVPTNKGLQNIQDIKIGDQILLDGKLHPVTEVHKNKSKKVGVLTTEKGYELEGTPDHQLYTIDGWVPMNKAETVVLYAEENRVWDENKAKVICIEAMHVKSFQDELEFINNVPEPIAAQFMRKKVAEESISIHKLVLLVTDAKLFQQALLSFGIFCSRLSNTHIVIEQPWAWRYVEKIGVDSQQIYQYLHDSQHMQTSKLSPDYCKHVVKTLARLDLQKVFAHPELLHKLQLVNAAALHNDLTYADLEDGIEIIKHLPIGINFEIETVLYNNSKDLRYRSPQSTNTIKDNLQKEQAIKILQSLVKNHVYWDRVKSYRMTKRTDVYDITVPSVSSFVANGIYVHNSTGIGFVQLYLLHRLLKLKNPSEFYGIKSGTILDIHFVGINFNNARKFMFAPMMANYVDSPFFQTYNEILDDVARKRGEKELYKVMDTFIYYRPAAIRMEPKSPSTRSLRGSTRMSFVVDELGHFSENKELVNISGQEIWNAMRNSLQTIRAEAWRLRKEGTIYIPPALALAISSPRDVADPIMVLRNDYTKANDAYTMLRPTWEANPRLTYDFLKNDIKDPIAFDRDFGCKPPFSEAAFISDPNYLFNAVDENAMPATYQKTVFLQKNSAGNPIRISTVELKTRRVDSNVPKVLAFDAGRELNAFAACLAYLNEEGKFVVDTLVEVRPRHGMHVSFSEMYKRVFVPLITQQNVVALASDRWQNAKITDDAQDDFRVIVANHQLNYDEFQQFRDDLIDGSIIIPKPEIANEDIIDINRTEEEYFDDRPVANFIRQSLRVVDEPGKTVSKPSSGNDDVFRAVVVAHAAMKVPEIAKVIRQGSLRKRTAGAIGVMATGTTLQIPYKSLPVGIRSGMPIPSDVEPIPKNPPLYKTKRSADGIHKVRELVKPKVKYK